MKWGIQSKLVLYFVLVIVLPVLIITLSLGIITPKIIKDKDLQDLFNINEHLTEIINRVEDQFDFIDDYAAFHRGIQHELIKFNGRLIIIDNAGYLLYDSEDKAGSQVRQSMNLELITGFDNDLYKINSGLFKYTHAIVVENNSVANAVIMLNMDSAINKVIVKSVSSIGTSVLLGFASMVIFIFFFSYLISRSILIPIKELYKAVDNVAKGEVDIKIQYTKEDELGRLCKAFNTMGSRLKESLDSQTMEINMRKELIASISHDLRTPIASIKGYVEGLQDGIAQDKKMFDRYLQVIADKTMKLDHLIDDLFQFSQLELGKLKMDREPLDSKELLLGILKGYEVEFQQQTVGFTVIKPFPSVVILADPRRIAQVMDNIIQNAQKFVPADGHITVGAVVEDHSLKVYIKDNGYGILKEDMPLIFDRFFRGEKSRSRDFGGTGLGLAICKQIISDHRGEIWAESVLGQGTTFYFTLPITNKINTEERDVL